MTRCSRSGGVLWLPRFTYLRVLAGHYNLWYSQNYNHDTGQPYQKKSTNNSRSSSMFKSSSNITILCDQVKILTWKLLRLPQIHRIAWFQASIHFCGKSPTKISTFLEKMEFYIRPFVWHWGLYESLALLIVDFGDREHPYRDPDELDTSWKGTCF